MTVIDKQGFLKGPIPGGVVIELGCGPRKKDPSWVGVDINDYEGVDLIGDVFDVLREIPDFSISKVYSSHFFEHITDIPGLLREIERILKPGGEINVIVPHFSNPYFYSDPTHQLTFGLYTFCYYATSSVFSREVPDYCQIHGLELEDVSLVFRSGRPFYARHAVKLMLGKLFNLSTWTKEFYEENLCYLFPCYEVSYRLKKSEHLRL